MTRDELLALEVESKVRAVGPEDVQTFYAENRARLNGQTLDQIGGPIRELLEARSAAEARQRYLAELRARASIDVSLEPPRAEVAVGRAERVKGKWDAPVTIVEYSDFECPFCARAGPTLQRIEETYGDRVRVVYRDFPLPNHSEARAAAHAARCAHEQGSFWPYHDLLFENQRSFSSETYRQLASKTGLDREAFDACLDSGKFEDEIESDYLSGAAVGVSATPTFFINGREVSGRPAVRSVSGDHRRRGRPEVAANLSLEPRSLEAPPLSPELENTRYYP